MDISMLLSDIPLEVLSSLNVLLSSKRSKCQINLSRQLCRVWLSQTELKHGISEVG